MTSLLLSLLAGVGVFYLYTAVMAGWTSRLPIPANMGAGTWLRARRRRLLGRPGQPTIPSANVASASLVVFVGVFSVTFAVFGGPVPALISGVFAASLPTKAADTRRRMVAERTAEAWPRMIEEIRVLTGSAGRSIPRALFEVGRHAPEAMRSAFESAHREWLLTTDFDRTIDSLKATLADPTADVVCETLLTAHQLGGTDLERRLTALAEDRRLDLQCRKDARARQAGARFARWFTVVVPVGMALVGTSIGEGRDAYRTGAAQALVALSIGMVIACWVWASLAMRLPREDRVFPEGTPR